jgi:acyl transferase domain-containing protein
MAHLDFIEGHGTGTSVGDVVEIQAVAQAMGGDARPRSCGIGTVKSIIGHTKAAAGVCGFIKAVIAANRRIIPPTANCTEPHPEFQRDGLPLYPLTRGRRFPADVTLRAGVSAMGFGGINCHVTITSGDPPCPALAPAMDEDLLMRSSQETELFPLAANTAEALAEACRALVTQIEGMAEGEMPDLAAACAHGLDKSASVRAALVAATPDELVTRAHDMLRALDGQPPTPGLWRESPDKAWIFGNRVNAARVAFIYPGQGSQMLNMARTLIERHEWARTLAGHAEAWGREINPDVALGDAMFRATDHLPEEPELAAWQRALTATQVAQPALCLASMVWTKFLATLGIGPVAVAGHSLGELTAFWAAGLFDDRGLLRLAARRGQLMAVSSATAGAMAALEGDRAACEDFLRGIAGYVVIANLNSPRQTVVSGERVAVDAVIARHGARRPHACASRLHRLPLTADDRSGGSLAQRAGGAGAGRRARRAIVFVP